MVKAYHPQIRICFTLRLKHLPLLPPLRVQEHRSCTTSRMNSICIGFERTRWTTTTRLMDATSSTTAVSHSTGSAHSAGAFVSESRVVLTNLHRHADGIYTSAMANVYVRNSFFDSNGRSFVVRDGPAVETYEGADIFLAPSAGNSVRRCVSVK